MSVLNSLLSLAVLQATTGYLKAQRSIGSVVADCTVEEVHEDRVTVTSHPVEKSAAVSDHAYREPARLRVRIGFSPSGSSSSPGPVGAAVAGLTSLANSFAASSSSSLIDTYKKLLAYKDNVELLTVVTGKRTYKNMVITAVGVTTDADTENALFVSLELEELVLTSTSTVSVPDNSSMAFPQQTGSVANTGAQSAVPNPPNYNAMGSP